MLAWGVLKGQRRKGSPYVNAVIRGSSSMSEGSCSYFASAVIEGSVCTVRDHVHWRYLVARSTFLTAVYQRQALSSVGHCTWKLRVAGGSHALMVVTI